MPFQCAAPPKNFTRGLISYSSVQLLVGAAVLGQYLSCEINRKRTPRSEYKGNFCLRFI